MEFAAVLSDVIQEDMDKVYPSLKGQAKVTVYEVAPKVLSLFDDALAKYAADNMRKQDISVKTEMHIKELRWGEPNAEPLDKPDPKGLLTLTSEEEGDVGIGMCVWTTGNAMNPFVEHGLKHVGETSPQDLLITNIKKGESNTDHEHNEWTVKKHEKTGALIVDDHLRIQLTTDTGTTASVKNIFAFGDNAIIESGTPPATAQTASQEAIWLAKRLNKGDIESNNGFEFSNKGLITYVGDSKGLMQTPNDKEGDSSVLQKVVPNAIQGKAAYLAWKGAYWSMTISWRNRILILVYWAVNYIFGRDISRF
jgi:NADH dehydrogenase